MNLRIITPPTAEPLSLGECMQHLNISLDDRHEDAWINRQIKAARDSAEQFLCMTLTDAVYEYRVDSFYPYRSYAAGLYAVPWWWDVSRLSADCGGIALPIGAIGSVSSITYVDSAGAVQTLSPAVYAFDDNPRAPVVRLAYGQSWPGVRSQSNAVVITFKGIYSETNSPPNSPPESIKSAIALMLAHWHENREAVVVGQQSAVEVPMGAQYLMQPYRLGMGV